MLKFKGLFHLIVCSVEYKLKHPLGDEMLFITKVIHIVCLFFFLVFYVLFCFSFPMCFTTRIRFLLVQTFDVFDFSPRVYFSALHFFTNTLLSPRPHHHHHVILFTIDKTYYSWTLIDFLHLIIFVACIYVYTLHNKYFFFSYSNIQIFKYSSI